MNGLFSLDQKLVGKICFDWISLSEFSTFDCAICTRDKRDFFLKSIASLPNKVHNVGSVLITPCMLRWSLSRNISFSEMSFGNAFFVENENQIDKFHKCFQNVEIIKVDNLCRSNISTLAKVLKHARNLVEFELLNTKIASSFILPTLAIHNKKLRVINLQHSPVSSDVLLIDFVSQYDNLKSINFSEMVSLTNEVIIMISNQCAKSLTLFNIAGCYRVSDQAILTLATLCHELRTFNVARCSHVTDAAIIKIIENNPKLSILDVSNCRYVTNATLLSLCTHSSRLSKLNVSGCEKITDVGIKRLADQCRALTEMNISNCKGLTDVSLHHVGTYCTLLKYIEFTSVGNATTVNNSIIFLARKVNTTLESFIVRENQHFNDFALKSLTTSCVNLKCLNISRVRKITDNGLITIAGSCRQLEVLDVSSCPLLTDKCIIAIAEKCRNMLNFQLSGCISFSDKAITRIAECCGLLKELNCSGCSLLTDISIIALTSHCTSLERLNVKECIRLTNIALYALSERCLKLVYLNIADCKLVSNKSLTELSYQCSLLNQLDVSNCKLLTQECILILLNNCRELSIVRVVGVMVDSETQNIMRTQYSNVACIFG